MRATKVGLLGAALLLAAATARGQDEAELVSDRPDFTESAVAVAPGRVQVEAGATTTRADQVMLGTASDTYTMAGITSGASKAAQGAPTHLVTSNASGDLAAYSYSELGLAQPGCSPGTCCVPAAARLPCSVASASARTRA